MKTSNKVYILALADYVVLYLSKNNVEITHLKLQKIIYYIQAWSLVYHDNELFNESPQAWVNGPVYPSIYQKFKKFNFSNITFPDVDIENIDEITSKTANELGLGKNDLHLINAVINKYGPMNPIRLVHLTHAEQPWNEARKDLNPFARSEKEISLTTMKSYYSSLLEKKTSA